MPRCVDCRLYNSAVGFCLVAEGRRTEVACERFQRRVRENPHGEFVNQMLHYRHARWYFGKLEEEKKQVVAPPNQHPTDKAVTNPKERELAEQREKATENEVPTGKSIRQAPPQNRLPQSPNLESSPKPSRFFTERNAYIQRSSKEKDAKQKRKADVFKVLSRVDE